MNAHALGILEFPRLLELVAERAASAPGAARVRALAPSADIAWLEGEHRRVAAVRSLLGSEPVWRPEPVPELTEIEHALRAMPGATGIERRDRAVMAFIILTGARDRAVASLKLKHVDLSTGTVFQEW